MDLDKYMYRLPLIGAAFNRMYKFFKLNTLFADVIHIFLGAGMILLIYDFDKYLWHGIFWIVLSLAGHLYAYVKSN